MSKKLNKIISLDKDVIRKLDIMAATKGKFLKNYIEDLLVDHSKKIE